MRSLPLLPRDGYGHTTSDERRWRRALRASAISTTALLTLLVVSGVPASASGLNTQLTSPLAATASLTIKATDSAPYPLGTFDSSDISGEAPPSAAALPGYAESYVTQFPGTSLPQGWTAFKGAPGGDAGSLWEPSHVVVSGGLLQLNASQDPAYGNQWVTGGLCQCGVDRTYGAYFVRSRMTGAGPTQVELLWPKSGWPPEIDFDETYGGVTSTSSTVHFTSSNLQDHRALTIDMTQWHTWGVIWSPTSITYTVDGEVWGTVAVASEVPDQPMTLDLTQQTWCSSGFACPTQPESTLVDWVAEYTPTSTATPTTTSTTTTTTTTTTVSLARTAVMSPFPANSSELSPSLRGKIKKLARVIKTSGDTSVVLVGYSDDLGTYDHALSLSRARAAAVERFLRDELANLGVHDVDITTVGKGSVDPVASNNAPSGRALNRRVIAHLT